MAANTTPIFGKTPILASVTTAAANPDRTGSSGTFYTIYTAGASGAIIFGINIKAIVTTTAGLVRIFKGTALVWEEPIIALTASATQFAWEGYIGRIFLLSAGQILKCNSEKAEAFVVTAEGYDYE